MIPVKGHKGLYRDENTNAILNCNDSEYEEYLRLKNNIINEKNEIDNLKAELKDIKSLLVQLLSDKS